ncbi:hypothetical protein MHU86_24694 [Fragilaria crotonensis]|nr:hypothetical protein MHU86_24694 [Fragilaria crotonensis]
MGTRMPSVAPIIALPYIGDTPLDVIIFVGTALYYRVYQWRRDSCNAVSRQEDESRRSHPEQNNDNIIHRAKAIEGYKDSGLYEFMDKCVERKRHLRKVGDPEMPDERK